MPVPTVETCLGISGQFEGGNGLPNYALLCGNSDKMGISVGCLQWNAGTGTLQTLLKMTLGGAPVANDQFAPLFALRDMKPAIAVAYAVTQWVDPLSKNKNLTAGATALWRQLLNTPQCKAAQIALAQAILDEALAEAKRFMPFLIGVDLRTAAFFFDVRVQQGGLTKDSWSPDVVTGLQDAKIDWKRAVNLARQVGQADTAQAWESVVAIDPLAGVLLHYAYERAARANPQYLWDTLARRGTIACRKGKVHGKWFDFTKVLP